MLRFPPEGEIAVAEEGEELVPGEAPVLHLARAVHLQQPDDRLRHLITIITNLKTHHKTHFCRQLHSERVVGHTKQAESPSPFFHKPAEWNTKCCTEIRFPVSSLIFSLANIIYKQIS